MVTTVSDNVLLCGCADTNPVAWRALPPAGAFGETCIEGRSAHRAPVSAA